MSQEQEVTLRNNKLWKVLDDCIKTKRYEQKRFSFMEKGTNKACVTTVFMRYNGLPDDQAVNMHEYLFNDPRFEHDDGGQFLGSGINETKRIIENHYKKTGKIPYYGLIRLNDNHKYTFRQFRNFFKGMDV